MKCKNCKIEYDKKFDSDFTNNECLPCVVEKDIKETELNQELELKKWNNKFNKKLSIDQFYIECETNIKKSDLKGFPFLIKIWEYMNLK